MAITYTLQPTGSARLWVALITATADGDTVATLTLPWPAIRGGRVVVRGSLQALSTTFYTSQWVLSLAMGATIYEVSVIKNTAVGSGSPTPQAIAVVELIPEIEV